MPLLKEHVTNNNFPLAVQFFVGIKCNKVCVKTAYDLE